jgi:sulfite oxidase
MEKDPHLITHTTNPWNAEPPVNKLREHFITPPELFYVRNHGEIPVIDPGSYRLVVNGLVEQPFELSLHSLINDFTKRTVMATLQCAGNRRNQLIDVAPIPGEVPWMEGAIGNNIWSGAPLNEILKLAKVKEGARYAEFMGADHVYRHGDDVGFGGSIPLEKALCNEVILAYEMNGKPLEATHGFPVRTIVPGYIGARSVKWLTHITLQEKPSGNYFQAHAYQLFPPQTNAETADWNAGLQLSELPVNCAITSPLNNAEITDDQLTVQGYATSSGKKIYRVDVSADGGNTWTTATIREGNDPWAWVFWEITLPLKSGEYEIVARAFDTASNTQPEDPRHVWNFKGYMNNAWHRVKVKVKSAIKGYPVSG